MFALCTVLIFMIDFVELLRQAGKGGNVPAWLLAWITILRLPAYTEILLPFAVLVGSIAALLMLARKSELAVMRAGGMSVWQFLRPGFVVALLLGVLSVMVYNPLAAAARDQAERLYADAFGRESNALAGRRTPAPGCARTAPTANRCSMPATSTKQRHAACRTSPPSSTTSKDTSPNGSTPRTASLQEGYWLLMNAPFRAWRQRARNIPDLSALDLPHARARCRRLGHGHFGLVLGAART